VNTLIANPPPSAPVPPILPWRIKPSWYLVTTEDRMIPPQAQRAMYERTGSTVVEVAGSHAIYLSQPAAVAHSSSRPLPR